MMTACAAEYQLHGPRLNISRRSLAFRLSGDSFLALSALVDLSSHPAHQTVCRFKFFSLHSVVEPNSCACSPAQFGIPSFRRFLLALSALVDLSFHPAHQTVCRFKFFSLHSVVESNSCAC